MGLFHRWRDSIGQLIHHSLDLKHIYEQCSRECSADCAVTTKFQHLRAAKHRIETYMTPMSRSVLDLSTIIAFATRVGIERRGRREGAAAEVFLKSLTPSLILTAALMADAGSEVLRLVRHLDTEDLNTAGLHTTCGDFLSRINWMFHQDGCFQVDGHTQFAVQWLRTPHFFSVRDVGRCIGGVDIMSEAFNATRTGALDHLRAWVVLAKDALQAEFPSFAVIQAFGAFELPRTDQDEAAGALTPARTKHLMRLSATCKQPELRREFVDHWPFAMQAFKDSGRHWSWGAWADAVRKTARIRGIASHPHSQLLHVLQRGMCFVPSTSGIEQSFSLVAARLGENRLQSHALTEDRAVRLLVARLASEDEDSLAMQARALWVKAFSVHSRMHIHRRVDAGIPKVVCRKRRQMEEKLSEGQFLARLHTQVGDKCQASGSDPSSMPHPSLWTDRHQKEKQFQLGKQKARLVEAHLACVYH